MHVNVTSNDDPVSPSRSCLETAGKTHHCLVGTQSTNISKITVSIAAIRKPTHAFFVSKPGPCLLLPLGGRTQLHRLHTPWTSTVFFSCSHAAISTLKLSNAVLASREKQKRDDHRRCAVASGSAVFFSCRSQRHSRSACAFFFKPQRQLRLVASVATARQLETTFFLHRGLKHLPNRKPHRRTIFAERYSSAATMRRKDRQMNTPELIAKGSAMVVGSGAWLGGFPFFDNFTNDQILLKKPAKAPPK